MTATRLPAYPHSDLPSFPLSLLPSFLLTRLPAYPPTRLPTSGISRALAVVVEPVLEPPDIDEIGDDPISFLQLLGHEMSRVGAHPPLRLVPRITGMLRGRLSARRSP
jgi:hypothetical protein